jgi:hypothetical protein
VPVQGAVEEIVARVTGEEVRTPETTVLEFLGVGVSPGDATLGVDD